MCPHFSVRWFKIYNGIDLIAKHKVNVIEIGEFIRSVLRDSLC